MTIISAFNAVLANIQFIGMLNRLNINWPSEWFTVTNWLDVSSLHFENLILDYQNTRTSVITARMWYLFISVCVPIAINVLLLVIFQPVYIVLWYLTLCTGFVLLVAGLFAMFLPGSVNAAGMDPLQFVIVGGALFGAAVLIALLVVAIRHCTRDENESRRDAYLTDQKYFLRFHRKRSLTHLCIFLIAFFVGLLCLQIAIITSPNGSTAQWFSGALFYIIGFIAFTIAGLALIYFALNLCRAGRKCVARATELAKQHLLLVMLTLISASFIPTISYAVNVYLCHSYTCPVGYVFNPYADRPAASYDTSPQRFCDPCTFINQQCGSSVDPKYVWCPGMDDNRWWKYPEISCSDEATVYFYISAAIVLINYLFGIPLLWFGVITYLTDKVKNNARIGHVLPTETEDEIYSRQMTAITPVAGSMYDSYRYSRRYFSLVQLAYRLVITFTLNVAAAYSNAAAALVFAFHGIACIVLVLVRPYISREEQWFSTALAVCNALNGAYAIIVWRVDNVPSYTTYIFVVLNGVIPAIAGIVVMIVLRKRRKQMARRAKKRMDWESAQIDLQLAEEAALRSTEHTVAEILAQKRAEEEMKAAPAGSVAGVMGVAEDPTGSPGSPNTASPGGSDSSSSSSDDEDGEGDAPNEPTNVAAVPASPLTEDQKRERKQRIKRIMRIREKNNMLNKAVYDEHSITMMNKAFMVMGVFFLIALGIGFMGLLRAPSQKYLIGGETNARGSGTMFAGYSTWSNFTSHCCCIQQTTPNPRFSVSERWICDNGDVLERGRVAKNGKDNGLFVRPLCSSSFRTGCSVAVDLTSSNVVLTCSDSSSIIPNAISQTAYDYMW